ncbi:hypothetical protein [Novosphingobium sp. FSW06-99]|uniref:hypothetical protein n=1 Tax=Novosphingobium sp. FSW06-99 TaxID=1739113 RepID=UPI0012E36D31|nr:hypothetical protein [Novosphingobium sp. FSW06-99]
MAEARRRKIHSKWAEMHPALAASERAVRLSLRDREDRFGHKIGTAATHAAAQKRRDGALARLYLSGAIDLAALGAAEEIAAAAERIGRSVGVRTMSMETRVDHGGFGDGAFWEGLGQVRREIAYRRWRTDLGDTRGAIEDLIVGDIGLVETAASHRVSVRRLRRLLVDALEAWPRHLRWARDWVREEDLTQAHAGLA